MGKMKKNEQDFDVFSGAVYPYYDKGKYFKNLPMFSFYYDRWYTRLLNLTINLYEWINIPDNIPERFIEEQLIINGKILCANTDNQGMIFTQYTEQGINMYHEALKYQIVNPSQIDIQPKTYYPHTVTPTKKTRLAVPVYNNPTKTPLIHDICMYADTLADISVSLKINVKQQRFPYVIKTSKTQRQAVRNLYHQIELGEPALFVDKDHFDDNIAFECLPTGVPYVADKLQIEKQNVIREYLTYIGINNKDMDKKERQTTDEINANNEEIDSYTDVRLGERKRACMLINKIFDKDEQNKVDVRRRKGERERLETALRVWEVMDLGEEQTEENTGGVNNG